MARPVRRIIPKPIDVNTKVGSETGRDYFRRDQRDGISPPDLSKESTFAEHIVHARGKRTRFTSVSLDLTKNKDFGDTDYRLDRQKLLDDNHFLVEHESLLDELRREIREGEKAERVRAVQALRYATRRKEGLVNWSFDITRVAEEPPDLDAVASTTLFYTVEVMDELFSCRNCIHDSGQSLLIGQGAGFCLQHRSVIWEPDRTTCKYLHRKDLPYFVVDEGTREHAAEFAGFPFLVSLDTKQPIERIRYSEKHSWEKGAFDPIVHALAQYHKVEPRWVLISAFSGGVDGRRALTHSCLVRHYLYQCNTWKSSYRLVLGLLEEIDVQPQFDRRVLVRSKETPESEAAEEATWDVVFARLCALQEYGWHAGLEPLMWASDSLNGSLAELNWPGLQTELATLRSSWIELIINSAKEHHEFFPPPELDSRIGQEIEE